MGSRIQASKGTLQAKEAGNIQDASKNYYHDAERYQQSGDEQAPLFHANVQLHARYFALPTP